MIPVEIQIFTDGSFSFITKTPPASDLIKKAIGLDKGSSVPHMEKVGVIKRDQVRGIAETKMKDLNARTIEGGHAHDRRHGPQHGRHG